MTTSSSLSPRRPSTRACMSPAKHLVAKKRALALSRLLSARLVIAQHREPSSPILTARLRRFGKDKVRSAVNIVLEALKGRRAGANLLEITTCGAIAPYNRILGGKLVALLMLSPQVSADYRRRYASPSIISSQMKNRRVIRDSTLVYLGTTSLYVHGSSQYNRLQLPAGTIAPDQESIRYNAIGQTSGFGTIQFSPDTSRAIDAYLAYEQRFQGGEQRLRGRDESEAPQGKDGSAQAGIRSRQADPASTSPPDLRRPALSEGAGLVAGACHRIAGLCRGAARIRGRHGTHRGLLAPALACQSASSSVQHGRLAAGRFRTAGRGWRAGGGRLERMSEGGGSPAKGGGAHGTALSCGARLPRRAGKPSRKR